MTRSKRGLASADKQTRDRVASEGGRAAHQKGTAHEFSPEEARMAGHKGGEATARTHGKRFYKEIGKKGGEARSTVKGKQRRK
jgi:uncharacterized protein